MVDKICSCDHEEVSHKLRDKSVDEILNAMRQDRTIEAKYSPGQMEALGFFVPQDNNKYYTYGDIKDAIARIRDTYSPCQKRFCPCRKFEADNLKTLEKMCERKTSQIVH